MGMKADALQEESSWHQMSVSGQNSQDDSCARLMSTVHTVAKSTKAVARIPLTWQRGVRKFINSDSSGGL